MGNYILGDKTCVEHSYDTLNELLNVVKHIDQNKIMSFAFEDGWKEEQVRKFILQIGVFHSKLKVEKYDLEEFAKIFNRRFATSNNECFTTVESIFSEIQNTLTFSMRVFLKFSKQTKARTPFVNGRRMQLPAYKGSGLGADYRQLLIPFIEADIVSPTVKELCKVTLDFFVDVREVLCLCKKVIRQEARIRKDPSKLSFIFQSCYDEVCKSCSVSIEAFKGMEDFKITNPMVKEVNETKNLEECLANRFHTQTDKEFQEFVIQDNVYKERKKKLHPLEEELWGKDWIKIEKIRIIIKCFDELNPKGSINNKEGKYRLKGKVVAMLMRWCGITDEHKNRRIFMKYFNETYRGEYLPIKDTAVYEAYGAPDDVYKKFEEQLNTLVEEKRKNEGKAA